MRTLPGQMLTWLATTTMVASCAASDVTSVTRQYDERYAAAQLDVLVASNATTAAVVYVHGGGWQGGARGNDRRTVEHLAQLGYVVINTDYRLVPEGTYPAAVRDVFCALAFVRTHAAELGIDPARIAVMGHSAGAHLVAMMALAGDVANAQDPACPSGLASAPNALISVAGPMDLTRMQSDIVEAFVGVSYAEDANLWRESSPITHVRPAVSPSLFIHSEHDLIVSVEQSELMVDALAAAGNATALLRLEGGGHILGEGAALGYEQSELATDTPEAGFAIADFLARTVGAQ